MRRLYGFPILLAAVWVASAGFCGDVRSAAVAGKFYPDDPRMLAAAVDDMMGQALDAGMERPLALVLPHAGYVYSGQIDADAFKLASRYPFERIVLLGTNHTDPDFQGISVYDGAAFEIPTGRVPVDEETARALLAAGAPVSNSRRVHLREHSIEVLLPFVRKVFPEAAIVPVIVAGTDLDMCRKFGKTLAEAVRGKNALIIASSDLSHYPEYADAAAADRSTVNAMLTLDPAAFLAEVRKLESGGFKNLATAACGKGAIMTAMAAAQALGADCGRVISRANSGDATFGDPSRVVGYAAVSFCRKDHPCDAPLKAASAGPEAAAPPLTDAQKQVLLAFARSTLRQYLESGTTPLFRRHDPAYEEKRGAFVTLKKHGELRGCIGQMTQDLPLYQVVGRMALSAALHDPRFTRLSLGELKDVRIEISALTPFQRVDSADRIRVGEDGVLLTRSGRSAVFLPQVAPEQGWNRDQLLENLCRKAGLSSDCWKHDAAFDTFQAVVFSEP